MRPQPPPGRPVTRPSRVEPGRGRLEQRHRGLLHRGALGVGAGREADAVRVGDDRVHGDGVHAGRAARGRDVDQSGAREALQAGAEPTPFGPIVLTGMTGTGQQALERRQLQQPGRDGGGRREAGQHQQQRASLRAALGRERVQRQVPGALHRGVDVRALLNQELGLPRQRLGLVLELRAQDCHRLAGDLHPVAGDTHAEPAASG